MNANSTPRYDLSAFTVEGNVVRRKLIAEISDLQLSDSRFIVNASAVMPETTFVFDHAIKDGSGETYAFQFVARNAAIPTIAVLFND